jgi:hypothetical protein
VLLSEKDTHPNECAGECLLSNALVQSAGGDGVSTATLEKIERSRKSF